LIERLPAIPDRAFFHAHGFVTVGPDGVSPGLADRPLVLAIDVGSSSVKGALHDRFGRTIRGTAVQASYDWNSASDGSVRTSHRALIDVVGRALDELHASVGALGKDVVAGGIASFIHSIVGLDDAGRPVTPVLSWADTTSASEAAELRKRVDAAAIHATTGAPIHAGYWPARVLRLRQEQPDIRRWSGLPELLAENLTGRAVVSRSMASGTGLLDRARGVWAEELLGDLRIEPEELSRLVGDDEPIGRLHGAAAERWPQFAGISWFAPWGDGGCGNVGLGSTGKGRAALMVGTSGALRAVVPEVAPVIPLGLFAQRLGRGAVVGGQLSEGGGTLGWASTLLRRSRAGLERRAAALEPDGHGLTVLPYTFGERGLGYHDHAHGAIVGLNPGTDAVSIYRAMLESIAGSFAAVDDQLARVLGGPPDIVASGGALAFSPLLTQVLADSLGRDIRVAPAVESSRRGAALLALQRSGHLTDLGDVPGPATRTIHADPNLTDRYRAARARRDALYRSVIRNGAR
jgi:gluconokinase